MRTKSFFYLSLLIAAGMFQSCKKGAAASNQTGLKASSLKLNSTTSNADLIAYKNSQHHLFLGFLVGDGNDPVASYNPANAPDSADFLEFFAGRDTVKADWRTAQAKGTRIVVCHFLSDAYFDGSSKDPATQVPGYVNPPGFNQTTPTSTSTYDHWARDMYAQHITNDQLDGIDLDIESGTLGGQVPTTTQAASLLVSVAKYFGPNCTQCTVPSGAKKPLFFYDTDGTGGGSSAAMYGNHKSNYDYVVFQSYTTGSHAWSGTGTASFPALVNTYGLDKLIFLVNGDSFKYPNGSEDQTGGDAKATSDLYSYANWVKSNNGVGVGVYRMSRDYNHVPPFAVSRKAIQLMNPSGN
ncbi:MAG: putative glycoside hydrolase Family 18, chitinase 18 [Mucilaginibacter sp.]|nr:putative glycoside hydrolase Family 18, chitinase 18 [Mucilaginibacter sp.]